MVSPYKVKVDAVKDEVSREIGKWSLYGVQTSEGVSKFVEIGVRGSFRFCRYSHKAQERYDGAYFQTCASKHRIFAIERKIDVNGARKDLRGLSVISWLLSQSGTTGLLTSKFSSTASWLAASLDFLEVKAKIDASDRVALVEALNQLSDAPAWVTCGVGCCSADDPS